MGRLTSGYHPTSTLAQRERVDLQASRADFDHDFAFVDEERHLHLAAVLGAFVAFWRQLHDPGAKEWNRHDLGVLELGACHIARDYRRGRKGEIYAISQYSCLTVLGGE